MKKFFALVLALCMVLALCACGASNAVDITYATGGSSGTYYGFSGVIANVLNFNPDCPTIRCASGDDFMRNVTIR